MKLQVSAIEFVADGSVVATIAMEGDTLVIKAMEGFKIRAEAHAGVQLLAQRASAQVEDGEVTIAAESAVKAQAQVIDFDASQALRETPTAWATPTPEHRSTTGCRWRARRTGPFHRCTRWKAATVW